MANMAEIEWASLWERLEKSEKQLTEGNKVSRPKIQRIPAYMAEKPEFQRYYRPQVISLGEFHRNKETGQGELYKEAWAAMYIKHTNLKAVDLFEQLWRDKPKLYKLYDTDSDKVDSKSFIVDGCCVLELLEKSDREQELKISMDKLVRVHQDLLILDNQVPFKLLRLLCEDQERLQKCLCNFLQVHGIQTAPKLPRKRTENEEVKVTVDGDDDEDPVHLLDYLRKALLMRDQHTSNKDINNNEIKKGSLHLRKYRIGTIRELKAAGIRVTKNSHSNSMYPSFKDGILQLPELRVDGSTAHIFFNLVAYEMCPDFHNNFEISSFLVFMSSLIDQPEDVKELRMARIIINELANDKEVADLFNKMDTILVPETPLFAHIRDQIDLHFKSKRGRIKMLSWMREAYNTYFRSPWTIIALLAATLVLVFTSIQAWFAIHPKAS
ncbi:uncharacterized protein LOC130948253 [Arachis stenosperma]|uniref:uncharacterized protein LOC130948253 n=1 Tax=Arachis stenosperma TaxID=217475 RepID=UPI0025AB976D|nr:uncharacterized protein LOC130948253 [Arachis stenosperma]